MLDSDDLLTALGRVVREREESVREGMPVIPQVPGSNERLVDAVVARLAQDDPDVDAGRTSSSSSSSSRTVRRALWLGLPALAAAAGLSVLFGRGVLQGGANSTLTLAPYAAELRGGISAVRSAKNTGPNRLTLAPGTELTVLLRPDKPVVGEVSALAALATKNVGTLARVVETRSSLSPSGSLRLTFAAPADLPLQGNLCVVVGREERLREGLVDLAENGEGWQRFCWQFVHLDAKPNP